MIVIMMNLNLLVTIVQMRADVINEDDEPVNSIILTISFTPWSF